MNKSLSTTGRARRNRFADEQANSQIKKITRFCRYDGIRKDDSGAWGWPRDSTFPLLTQTGEIEQSTGHEDWRDIFFPG